METITMLEFRKNMPAIAQILQRKGEMMVTHRGRPAFTIGLPRKEEPLDLTDDPIYRLGDYADSGASDDATMTNEKIDEILYGFGRPCDP